MLWQKVLSEHVRELDYVADLAGITSNISISSDHLNFSYVSYNDKMEEYLTKVFSQIQNIDVHEEEQFFKNVLENKIRAFKNSLKSEPYQKTSSHF